MTAGRRSTAWPRELGGEAVRAWSEAASIGRDDINIILELYFISIEPCACAWGAREQGEPSRCGDSRGSRWATEMEMERELKVKTTKVSKLQLQKDTLLRLGNRELTFAVGGSIVQSVTTPRFKCC